MVELVTRIDRQRFVPHVVCFSPTGPLRRQVEAAGIPIVSFPIASGFASPATWRQMLRFARWCRSQRIAVLQTSDFYTNIFALPAAALARVPVRLGGRRELRTEKSNAKLRLQRLAYAAAHTVVANSEAAAAFLRAERVPTSRIAVVPNGLDPLRFEPRTVTRVRRIVTVANLRAEKGHDVLLEAAAEIVRQGHQVEFVIIGDGPQRPHIEAGIERLDLGRVVRLRGQVDDVAGALSSADLFVLPSRSEAFPNAVLEAMASGLPVVATAVGGLLELIETGHNGMLVPVGDSLSLARTIAALIEDPVRAAALGAEARRTITSRYSFDRMVASFERLYLQHFEERHADSVGEGRKAPAGGYGREDPVVQHSPGARQAP
jgi:glycosyltransferase involved in cell wall biosynthesis